MTCFNMASSEIREANLASSAAVEGFRTGELPPSSVNKVASLLSCCNIWSFHKHRETYADVKSMPKDPSYKRLYLYKMNSTYV